MKKLLIAALVIAAAACSPHVYPLQLDIRQPSSSGIDLTRKSMSIVYMDGTNQIDSLFDRSVASAMARGLEADYFDGEEAVTINRIPSADSVGLDLMHTLVMETEGDVVFLLNSSVGEDVRTKLFIYDSMGEDKVLQFKGNARIMDLDGDTFEDKAADVGTRIFRRFHSRWNKESFNFYYFDDFSSEAWFDPLQDASDGLLTKAIDGWALILKSGSAQKRACACYNIAQAFYLLEDYELSSKWLVEADRLENLSLSDGLHKRLEAHLEKLQK